jgi:hypothetical protein
MTSGGSFSLTAFKLPSVFDFPVVYLACRLFLIDSLWRDMLINNQVLRDKPKTGTDDPWDWAASLPLAPEALFSRDDGFSLRGVRGVLNRDRFLSELNQFRDFPQTVSKMTLTSRGSPSILHHLPRVPVLMNAQLRMYVNEWLDTGLKGGIEDPRARDLRKAPNACWAIRSFANKQKLRLEPAPDGLYLHFPSEREARGIAGLGDSALDQANRLFSLFFLSDWRARLAKCRRCGDYFQLKQSNRSYKRGIACTRCARVRSAVLSTSNTRKWAETELFRLVAKRFGRRIARYPDWHRDTKFRARIIAFLIERIRGDNRLAFVYPRGITGKWLSWSKNRAGIEKAAKGDKAAPTAK